MLYRYSSSSRSVQIFSSKTADDRKTPEGKLKRYYDVMLRLRAKPDVDYMTVKMLQ